MPMIKEFSMETTIPSDGRSDAWYSVETRPVYREDGRKEFFTKTIKVNYDDLSDKVIVEETSTNLSDAMSAHLRHSSRASVWAIKDV